MICHSYQKEWKLINAISFYEVCMIKNCVIHIRALKQTFNHGLILKQVHQVIQFIQEAWLKKYIDVNTGLKKQAKSDF